MNDLMHKLLVVGSINVVREIDQKLRKAALGGCIVSQNRREGSIAEGLGKALAQSLTGTSIIAQTRDVSKSSL
jgi:hypothetical protein